MDLLKEIMSDPKYFHILLDSGEEIQILKYTSINIDFSDRIKYRNGKKETIKVPNVIFGVELDTDAKNQLKKLFPESYSSNRCTVHVKEARVKIGDKGYIYKAQIAARPRVPHAFVLPTEFDRIIKISLKLECTEVYSFDSAENYKISNRFEIMDL